MKIRTQFIITMLLFGIILAVLAASAILTNQLANKAAEQEKIASSIAQGANDLSYLCNDYLIYRESQQLKRWQSSFASFSSQVASLDVDKPEQQVLAHNIKANEERLKQVFDSVASALGSPSQNRSAALNLTFLQVSWSRMAVQSQGLVSDASRLSQLLRQQADRLREIRTILMYIMVGLFGLFLLISYMLTYRRILKSIMTLQAGTAVIGFGNLDFKIEEKKNDEIGDLSHAFNRMTTNLKEVTASKKELEREIAERKKAEEALRQQREWLRVTLTSIGDAVIASDTKGQITFLNPVAVTLTGWQSEEALNQPINNVFRIINEKTHEPAADLAARVLSEKRMVALANDTALVTKDGCEVPIEDSAAPILDAAGNVAGVVLVFHDVTAKRRAQAELREALDRAVWLARFPEQNPNPVMRASSDGTVLYCNPASAKFPGWRCEVGQVLPNELLSLVGRAMGEGGEVQKDVELARRVYFVSITPFPGEGYANVYVRDITERKRAEEALRDAQKLVEANLDAMTRLQKLGTLFVREGNMEAVFAEIVDAAIAISGADFGNIQLLDPKSSDLKVAAQRGFPKWWLDFWNSVCEGQGACGTALEREERVIVEDVEQSPIFVGTPALEIQLKAGVRAVQSTPLVSRTGKPLGMFSTHYKTPHRPDDRALRLLDLLARQTADIIERARAEEVLRESEERLNRAQEIAHLGSWELNLDNNRLTWSDEVYRIFGLQPQEFGATYEAFLDAVHPDDRAAVDAAYSGSLREGRDTYEIEHQVVRKSTGETRIVHERCQHIRDTSGRIVRSIGMVHDVTERKRMEEELRQSEEKSRLLIKYAPSMFYEIDFHRPAFISVNDTMCQFLGYSREELLAMNPFDLLDDEGKALFRERIRRKFAGEEISDSVEYKSKTKDGREVYGVLNMSFTYKDGKPEGAVVVAHDITERKRAEELLWQRTEELQRLSETLEQQVQERTEELEVANEELKNEIDECLRVETDLRKSQSDLRQLSLELLNAQEKERKLVAGEIHDSIGSSLSAIKFKVVTALTEVADKSPETAAALQSMIPIVQGAIDESRRIQTNLRPSMLDDLGILATVRWFCRQFESTYAKIRLRQSIKIEEHEVPESLKTVIFRVLQEGLNNVAKHSRANIVLLSLQKADRAVKLTVRDNGQGFDLPKAQTADGTTQGLGLKNMRERIELSGGSFEIESTKGKGTVLRAWWPI